MAKNQAPSAADIELLNYLTKEEKEALLSKKIAEIQKKNKAILERQKEIADDKKRAEQLGRGFVSNSHDDYDPVSPRSGRGVGERQPRGGRGRAKRPFEQQQKSSREPPSDPSYSYLSDRKRDRSPTDRSSNRQNWDSGGARREFDGNVEFHRNARNFGGSNFNNVPGRMKSMRARRSYRGSRDDQHANPTITMTGKERRDYEKWRHEREEIDTEWKKSQKDAQGNWKREWDAGKDDKFMESLARPPSPRNLEPNRRPDGTGRPNPSTLGDFTTHREGRGGGRGRGRGRGGGGGGNRPRFNSNSSEERSVEEKNDSLIVRFGTDVNPSPNRRDYNRGGGGGGRKPRPKSYHGDSGNTSWNRNEQQQSSNYRSSGHYDTSENWEDSPPTSNGANKPAPPARSTSQSDEWSPVKQSNERHQQHQRPSPRQQHLQKQQEQQQAGLYDTSENWEDTPPSAGATETTSSFTQQTSSPTTSTATRGNTSTSAQPEGLYDESENWDDSPPAPSAPAPAQSPTDGTSNASNSFDSANTSFSPSTKSPTWNPKDQWSSSTSKNRRYDTKRRTDRSYKKTGGRQAKAPGDTQRWGHENEDKHEPGHKKPRNRQSAEKDKPNDELSDIIQEPAQLEWHYTEDYVKAHEELAENQRNRHKRQEAEDEEDVHNSSAESLERFIAEHTLKLDKEHGIAPMTTVSDDNASQSPSEPLDGEHNSSDVTSSELDSSGGAGGEGFKSPAKSTTGRSTTDDESFVDAMASTPEQEEPGHDAGGDGDCKQQQDEGSGAAAGGDDQQSTSEAVDDASETTATDRKDGEAVVTDTMTQETEHVAKCEETAEEKSASSKVDKVDANEQDGNQKEESAEHSVGDMEHKTDCVEGDRKDATSADTAAIASGDSDAGDNVDKNKDASGDSDAGDNVDKNKDASGDSDAGDNVDKNKDASGDSDAGDNVDKNKDASGDSDAGDNVDKNKDASGDSDCTNGDKAGESNSDENNGGAVDCDNSGDQNVTAGDEKCGDEAHVKGAGDVKSEQEETQNALPGAAGEDGPKDEQDAGDELIKEESESKIEGADDAAEKPEGQDTGTDS